MTEITLVGIITSATLATNMMNADNQVTKINTQQEQVKCVQQSVDNLNSNLDSRGHSLYEYARSMNSQQPLEQKCKIEEQIDK